MALQSIPGSGLWLPAIRRLSSASPSSATSMLIDASTEKAAFVGRVWNKDRTSKSITKVHFRFGAVTKTNGSSLTVSLQDVSLTSGPPMQPDGVQDQTATVANVDANFASNTWYTATLGASRSVSYGDLLAVVVEYASFSAGDSVVLAGLTAAEGPGQATSVLFTGSWAVMAVTPNVILEFSDGTFGTLFGAFPYLNLSSQAFKQDTAGADEYALAFSFPAPCKVDGCWLIAQVASASSDFDVVLYSGTTALASVTVDANTFASTASNRFLWLPFAEQSLSANTTYYLAVKPTQTAGNVTIQYYDVAASGHFQTHGGGSDWHMAARVDLGAWDTTGSGSAYLTRRPFMGLSISAIDDGVGGGSGAILSRVRSGF